ncbi:transcriptional regulator [Taibaiella sp. KBW10]|uniref:helix-turn-helix domain-containing protein n=1 Tax=Taibaiella sp. KBW10 TaxID=2153357 RepID=UPI000F5AEE80|nr:AraC family transcriptional regulator [Taibaiella sp. KBW10]RQO30940.1 transcriptional regulator [Taibaiella sp. KBW10]
MLDTEIEYLFKCPDPAIARFVDSFWMLCNHSKEAKEIVLLPDGRIDLFFSYTATEPYHVTLLGLETEATKAALAPQSVIFAISFTLLAMEYILDTKVSSILNDGQVLADDFWGFAQKDLHNFDYFCTRASLKIKEQQPEAIDSRKERLFELIYASEGALTVQELSERVYWSSRQINRYFNQQFGISLKAYCDTLRFRASFRQIREGKLFPEQNFSDQAHFIREIKKRSGVTPKELAQNKNDRFIQLSTLPKP